MGGGLRGNKPNHLGPFQWVFEINSLKGTQLITFITPQPLPPIFYMKTKSEPDFET